MKLSRPFTKVYTRPRRPLMQTLERFFDAIENTLAADVRFAFTGEETATVSATDQQLIERYQGMTIPFTVHSESMDEYDRKGGGKVKTRKLMLLDASDGPRLSQILEMNLPEEHKPLGVGTLVNVQIDEITQIFSGRPRIRGVILPAKK